MGMRLVDGLGWDVCSSQQEIDDEEEEELTLHLIVPPAHTIPVPTYHYPRQEHSHARLL